MLTRWTFLFTLFSVSLLAQPSTQWQTYLFPSYIIGGAETMDHIWLAANNSIVSIDQKEGTETLWYFKNSPLPDNILDVFQLSAEEFVVLGWENKLVFWENGVWREQILEMPNSGHLRNIIGLTANNQLMLNSNGDVYLLDNSGDLVRLPYAENFLNNGYLHMAELDAADRLWLIGHQNMVLISSEGEMLWESTWGEEYILDFALDESNNAWISTSRNIYFWNADGAILQTFPIENLDVQNGGVITAVADRQAVFTIYGRVYQLTAGANDFQVEEWTDTFETHQLPNTYGYRDQEGKFWYINYQRVLNFWEPQAENSPEDHPITAWLPVSNIAGLGMDPQGKIWIGGSTTTAYMMGGRWHPIPLDSTGNISIGVNDIVFKPDGTPIIGTGDFFVFGFPDSQAREWNGVSWDTIHDAVSGPSFLPVTDLQWDADDNLWVLRSFENLFSVRHQGSWNRFLARDLPGGIAAFTCLAPDNDGSMWIGTDNGLINYNGFQFNIIDSSTLHTEASAITSIAVDEAGDKWIALGNAGLRRQVGDEWVYIEEIEEITRHYGATKVICGTYPEVWVTLQWDGVLHYDGEKWEHLRQDNSGLVGDFITNVLTDSRGRVWFTGGLSVSVYTPDYPEIEPFSLQNDEQLSVFPNPGCCRFEVHWEATNIGPYELDLFAIDGRFIHQWTSTAAQTGEQSFSFDQGNLPSGTYLISLSHKGEQKGTTRLMILD